MYASERALRGLLRTLGLRRHFHANANFPPQKDKRKK